MLLSVIFQNIIDTISFFASNRVIIKCILKRKGGKMSGKTLEKKRKQDYSQEFETYLQTRRLNTTYNGIELENASWQKEVFGFKDKK